MVVQGGQDDNSFDLLHRVEVKMQELSRMPRHGDCVITGGYAFGDQALHVKVYCSIVNIPHTSAQASIEL